jgi:eukaryotic-like serine/threonine-protein kinase
MTPERWQEIERIYHLARAQSTEERESFLTKACAKDGYLRREVESLLTSRFEAKDFLEDSAMDVAAKAIASKHLELNARLIGQTLLHYRILHVLGQGGMGDVFLAEDTNLNRKVAVKLLPNTFFNDPGKVARFEREAKLLATLNHPNIAAIYGLEQAEGKRFMVMEWVEGETLAQRLTNGPLPLEKALDLCRQIAEGLEAAHEKGIIHRDLKPANVMISEGDEVKILDFGLAKALASETQALDASRLPSISALITQPGVIFGTAAYMSPEQAKGKPVDKRADIWAFGVLLYEMLTGKQPFTYESVADTLVAVLTKEPDWKKVAGRTQSLLHRCLEKDPRRRLRDIGEAMAWIEHTPDSSHYRDSWLAWGVAALFILAFGLLYFVSLHHRTDSPPSEPMQLQITPTVALAPEGSFALSPDSRWLAFAARSADGLECIWIRALDSLQARPLSGTESDYIPPLFWSPDSRFVVFSSGGKLKKIDVSGGPQQILCDIHGYSVGGTWNRNGVIIIGHPNRGLMRISADGRSSSILTIPNQTQNDSKHMFPIFLPDGRHFLYYCLSGKPERSGIYIGSLDTRPEDQSSKPILSTNFGAGYVPSGGSGIGRLLFMQEQTLMVQPFDETRLELTGESEPVAEKVASFMAFGFFSASANEILVYRSGSAGQINQLTWFDRQGKRLGKAGGSGEYWGLSLSPDGTRGIASWLNPAQLPLSIDLWFLNFANDTRTRFTSGEGNCQSPIWSPDGSRVIFISNREKGFYDLYQKPLNGVRNAELLFRSGEEKDANSWSSDSRLLMFTAQSMKTRADLWVLSLEEKRDSFLFLNTEFNEFDGHFSPDARWVAYTSDESGSNEIYVRRFAQVARGAISAEDGQWMISKGGGTGPRWSGDGKELYYRSRDGTVMVAEIASGKAFRLKGVHPLFPVAAIAPKVFGSYVYFYWDAMKDGRRFLIPTSIEDTPPSPFSVVLNWPSLLKNGVRR